MSLVEGQLVPRLNNRDEFDLNAMTVDMAQRTDSSYARRTVLVVAEDVTAAELVRQNLQAAGFYVAVVSDRVDALRRIKSATPDIVMIDVASADNARLKVCKLIRANRPIQKLPIVILSASSSENDRLRALEFGADDYLAKPFNPRELVLRTRNLLRRCEENVLTEEIVIGDLLINIPRNLVRVREQKLSLTPTEFRLLRFLAEHRDRIFSRNELLLNVWQYEANVTSRTVDTHVRRLRDKLGSAGHYIGTIRGVGYSFSEPARI